MGPISAVDGSREGKHLLFLGFEPWTVYPVANRYTKSASKSLSFGVIVSAHSFLWLRIGTLGGSNCQKRSESSIGTLVHTGAEKKLSVTLILSDSRELFFF